MKQKNKTDNKDLVIIILNKKGDSKVSLLLLSLLVRKEYRHQKNHQLVEVVEPESVVEQPVE